MAKDASSQAQKQKPAGKSRDTPFKKAVRSIVGLGMLAGIGLGAQEFVYGQPFKGRVETFDKVARVGNYEAAQAQYAEVKKAQNDIPTGFLMFTNVGEEMGRIDARMESIHPKNMVTTLDEWVTAAEKSAADGAYPNRKTVAAKLDELEGTISDFNYISDADNNIALAEVKSNDGIRARMLRFDAHHAIVDIENLRVSEKKGSSVRAYRELIIDHRRGDTFKLGGKFLDSSDREAAAQLFNAIYLEQESFFVSQMKDAIEESDLTNEVLYRYAMVNDSGDFWTDDVTAMQALKRSFDSIFYTRKEMGEMYAAISTPEATFSFPDSQFEEAQDYMADAYVRHLTTLSDRLDELASTHKVKSSKLESNVLEMQEIIGTIRQIEDEYKKYTQDERIGETLEDIRGVVTNSASKVIDGTMELLKQDLRNFKVDISNYLSEDSKADDEKNFFESFEKDVKSLEKQITLFEGADGDKVEVREFKEGLEDLKYATLERFVYAEQEAAEEILGKIRSGHIRDTEVALSAISKLHTHAKKYRDQLKKTDFNRDKLRKLDGVVRDLQSLGKIATCHGYIHSISSTLEGYKGDKSDLDKSFQEMQDNLDSCVDGLKSYRGSAETVDAINASVLSTRQDISLAWADNLLLRAEQLFKVYVGIEDSDDSMGNKISREVAHTNGLALLEEVDTQLHPNGYSLDQDEVKERKGRIAEVKVIKDFKDVIEKVEKMDEYNIEGASYRDLENTIRRGLNRYRVEAQKKLDSHKKFEHLQTYKDLKARVDSMVQKQYTACAVRARQLEDIKEDNSGDYKPELNVRIKCLEIAVKHDGYLLEELNEARDKLKAARGE